MKVLLIDESVAIQRSFGALLQVVPGVAVVGYAEDVCGALASIVSNPPDLIVLDAELRGHDGGIEVLRYVVQHHPDIPWSCFPISVGPPREMPQAAR